MSYFSESYPSLRFPLAEESSPGLRRAQIGAVHAVGAYFSQPRRDPGIVVMPTGSGKTAVICISAFLLRPNRVLILTPSQLVRTQIAEQMASLGVLKRAGVLPEDFPCPKVREVKKRLTTEASWQELEDSDFVVATPQCVSPGIEGNQPPPEGFFELILMDEAHHSEAPRWSDILKYFESARRLLFTATPFRRDKKELKGSVIYNFPLKLAHDDKIFGNIRFLPVNPPEGLDHDIAIARQAEIVYKKDRNDGFNHRLMVRTDSKKRADHLSEIYGQNTKLNLAVVHSNHTLARIRKTLKRLTTGEIDGIICVAMMGEGFDFPELKIAAVHSPHKSLAVTLQFIGRFARTTGEKLGEAKFLAVPKDIEAETNELYKDSATWQDIVSDLSSARIEKEVRSKEISASFASVDTGEFDIADVVLMDFKPYFHVKIYRIAGVPDLRKLPDLGKEITVLRHEVSEEHSSSVLLLRQVTRPRWSDLGQFSRIEHDLVVLHYNEEAGLLFINSSRRTLEFYRPFEEHYGRGTAALIPTSRISRVLAGLQNPDFFSVGLKNSVQNSNTESYQIKTGPSAQNAISPADALIYQRGHVFGKGINASGQSKTIGYSSSSKVWSNYSARISELIEWCQDLTSKLQTRGAVVTGTPLDALLVGEEVDKLPYGVIGVGWPAKVFNDFPRAKIISGGEVTECDLLDLELHLDQTKVTEDSWEVLIEHTALGTPARLKFTLDQEGPRFQWVQAPPSIKVIQSDEETALIDYLKHYPLAFYLEDFSRLDGATIFYNKSGRERMVPTDCLTSLDWASGNINIEREFPSGGVDFKKPTTVQEFLGQHLVNSDQSIVFYDHGSGEMADFVSFREGPDNSIVARLYHCKGSGGKNPGDRVGDAYEVCGQVVKCLIWLKKKQYLRTRILDREGTTQGKSRFIKGSRNDLLRLLSDDNPRKLSYEIYVVQPGIPISGVTEKIGHILGAASDYVRRASAAKMLLIGSS